MPGWQVRVVPNKYPAITGSDGRHEVVIHSPDHKLSIGDLSDGELAAVAAAWQARASAARAEGFGYVHAFVNEGRAAGGSLEHTHSQLVWLRDEPPAVLAERQARTSVAQVLASERRAQVRVVAERDGIVAVCPDASLAPYALLVAPLEPEADAYTSDRLTSALALLAGAVRRLRAVEGAVPLNAWLHTGRRGTAAHWHVELLPRLTVAAGLELGAGIYVNPLPPEEAAATLRAL
jgi:UDPglucose--hexose-1-phosphate uridylyltransferase